MSSTNPDRAHLEALEAENRRLRDKAIDLMAQRERAYAALEEIANLGGWFRGESHMREIARAALKGAQS